MTHIMVDYSGSHYASLLEERTRGITQDVSAQHSKLWCAAVYKDLSFSFQ